MERKVRNLRRGEEKKHFEILNLCFPSWGSKEKWRKKYSQEGFDATKDVLIVEENGEWIGGVAVWFREVFLKEGRKAKVYIAGDGYVHPSHRGKGVYSTFMRRSIEVGRKRGASFGFGFISIYSVPFTALPKYGFVDIFYPMTRIFVLNAENFLKYMMKKVQNISVPRKYDGMKLKLIISSDSAKGKFTVSKIFYVRQGKLWELTSKYYMNNGKIDLQISTNIQMLLEIFENFHLRKKILYPTVFIAFIKRRLKLRFSIKFLKSILRA